MKPTCETAAVSAAQGTREARVLDLYIAGVATTLAMNNNDPLRAVGA